jgi:hypothetical protein
MMSMAAKKRSPKRDGKTNAPSEKQRVPRKEPYTSERLLARVERLREQAARLSGLARAMDDVGVESVVVDGHAMLLRGLDQIDNFTDNASRAVRAAKTSRLEQ